MYLKAIENQNSEFVRSSQSDYATNSDISEKSKFYSVNPTIKFISENQNGELAFSEFQLPDVFYYEILQINNIHIPVIFITPENNFMMKEILINKEFISKNESIGQEKIFYNKETLQKLPFKHVHEERRKTRLLVKRGVSNIALLLTDIVAIYTKNKLVYVIDRNAKKYSLDKTLTELEEEMDKSIFFRANRQYIINIIFVKSFKTIKKVKLLIDMDIPELEEPVIVSQHVAPAFKKWMEDA